MKKTSYLKWVLGGILPLVVIVALTIVYSWSTWIIHKTYQVPLTTIAIPSDSAAIWEGARLIRIEHCRSCHGEQFEGTFQHKAYRSVLVAPNITALVATYSNEELERLIRHGVKKSGKSVFGMPSQMFFYLKDESVANIIAYLRTLKPVPSASDLPSASTFYPLRRWEMITGKYRSTASRINHQASRQLAHHDTAQLAFGKYLVMTACTSCHGENLQGQGHAPNMRIAGAYSNAQFIHFLKTGEGALGRKELSVMSAMAKNHLSYLSISEMNAIYAYLKSLSVPVNLAEK